MLTVVVFGANGMLGAACVTYFSAQRNMRVIPYTRDDFDVLSDPVQRLDALASQWTYNNHTYVINAVGLIPQRKDTNPSHYIQLNSVFPHLLNRVCQEHGAQLIHITTDCVYDGANGPYAEGAPPTELGIYGASKSCGEPSDAMVIRTSIIGEDHRVGLSLLEWVRSQPAGSTIQGYTNHFWNGVTCPQLARFIHTCIDHETWWSGVRHVTSPNTVSKYELVTLIRDTYGLDLHIEPFATDRTVNKALLPSRDPNVLRLVETIPSIQTQLKELN